MLWLCVCVLMHACTCLHGSMCTRAYVCTCNKDKNSKSEVDLVVSTGNTNSSIHSRNLVGLGKLMWLDGLRLSVILEAGLG